VWQDDKVAHGHYDGYCKTSEFVSIAGYGAILDVTLVDDSLTPLLCSFAGLVPPAVFDTLQGTLCFNKFLFLLFMAGAYRMAPLCFLARFLYALISVTFVSFLHLNCWYSYPSGYPSASMAMVCIRCAS
jgi:hypothetical protein